VEAFAYLSAARQTRLAAKVSLSDREALKAEARFWLAMARKAQPPPLP
jgi:hypothetical protein